MSISQFAERKKEIVAKMIETGMIPVFYHDDVEVCKSVMKACHEGGVRVFEFTNRGVNAFKNFKELKLFAETKLRGMILGVGSVIKVKETQEFIKVGAEFIVSPVFKKDIANECNKVYKLFIPGCATPTEIVEATELGCDIVKVFPAESLGPKFVANIMGPLPWLKLMPTGGVEATVDSIEKWFKSGVVCVGMGSQLIRKEYIQAGTYDELANEVKHVLELVDSAKKKYRK